MYTTPELKQPAFLALNRNGMAPVIEDPNNKGLLLAEVSAERIDQQLTILRSGLRAAC